MGFEESTYLIYFGHCIFHFLLEVVYFLSIYSVFCKDDSVRAEIVSFVSEILCFGFSKRNDFGYSCCDIAIRIKITYNQPSILISMNFFYYSSICFGIVMNNSNFISFNHNDSRNFFSSTSHRSNLNSVHFA